MAGLYQKEFSRSTQKNYLEVVKAYGMEEFLNDEAKIVAELFKRYESLTKS